MKNRNFFYIIIIVFILNFNLFAQQINEPSHPINISKEAFINFRKGFEKFLVNQYPAAAEYFQKSIELTKKISLYYIWYSHIYYMQGEIDIADKIIQKAKHAGLTSDEILMKEKWYEKVKTGRIEQKLNEFKFDPVYVINGQKLFNGQFFSAVDIFLDNNNDIFLTCFKENKVIKFDANSKFLFEIKDLKKPRKTITDANGNIYIANFGEDKVKVYDRFGILLREIGSSGKKNGEFFGPYDIAIDKKGFIYIIDFGNARIEKFTKDGKFILQLGKSGDLPGQFVSPVGICVLDNNNIAVLDKSRANIQIFDETGNYLKTIGSGLLKEPNDFKFLNDKFFVLDEGFIKVLINKEDRTKYDRIINASGDLVSFNQPIAFDFNLRNFLYVIETNNSLIRIYKPNYFKLYDLNVDFKKIKLNQFPTTLISFSLYDKNNKPFWGLRTENLKLRENDVLVKRYKIYRPFELYQKNEVALLVDLNYSMNKEKTQVRKIINKITGYSADNTFFGLYGVKSNGLFEKLDFIDNKFLINHKLRFLKYSGSSDPYRSMTQLINKMANHAAKKDIIYITNRDTLSNKELFKIYLAAENNDIGIYIIDLRRGPDEKFSSFCKKIMTKYQYLRNLNEQNLIEHLFSRPSHQYLLAFYSTNPTIPSGSLITLDLEAQYLGMITRNSITYVAP